MMSMLPLHSGSGQFSLLLSMAFTMPLQTLI
jgi:hypothetical protein